ncbi:type II secretion system protein GspJ [Marinobacter halodurans]|uniref:Type II secretion system protein J n=1 Tax=Marinobacter halodurans TaxID=2528979 RepID=A0ABY1ZMY5_9GAMM|nr:type II secretion system minor pseudopilin GspJ [Marinobacter halodurans]TBW56010.1 type II secretion system protein GspJ [Marinobacter halodurans]
MTIECASARPKQGGFTLLEVLIAVGITALIGVGVWQMISGVIQARDRVNAAAEEFEQIQRAMLVIERDLDQVVNRPVRDIYGDARYAMTSREEGVELALTRQGWRNPTGARRSDLQRVSYEFTGDELHRRYWGTLDLAEDAKGRDQLLLSHVEDVEVRFLDDQGTWQDEWPTTDQAAAQTSDSPSALASVPLPRGVAIVIKHTDYGELQRVFVLPDFDPKSAQGAITESVSPANGSGTGEEEPGGQTESTPGPSGETGS